ncbi:hypothetical protein PAYE108092_16895 [Paracoccus yeei]
MGQRRRVQIAHPAAAPGVQHRKAGGAIVHPREPADADAPVGQKLIIAGHVEGRVVLACIVDQVADGIGFGQQDVVVTQSAPQRLISRRDLVAGLHPVGQPGGVKMRRPDQVRSDPRAQRVQHGSLAIAGRGEDVELARIVPSTDQDARIAARVDHLGQGQHVIGIQADEFARVAGQALGPGVGGRLVRDLEPVHGIGHRGMVVQPVQHLLPRAGQPLDRRSVQRLAQRLAPDRAVVAKPRHLIARIAHDQLEPGLGGRLEETLELGMQRAVGVEAVFVEAQPQRVHMRHGIDQQLNELFGVAVHAHGNGLELRILQIIGGVGGKVGIKGAIGLVHPDLVVGGHLKAQDIQVGRVGHGLVPANGESVPGCGAKPGMAGEYWTAVPGHRP